MIINLRPYQQEAVNAVYEHLSTKDTNPCVVLPTGTGRSLVLAKAASDAVTLWGSHLLILAHVKELLEQNADKVRRLCPELKVGVYSTGLIVRDRRESVIVRASRARTARSSTSAAREPSHGNQSAAQRVLKYWCIRLLQRIPMNSPAYAIVMDSASVSLVCPPLCLSFPGSYVCILGGEPLRFTLG